MPDRSIDECANGERIGIGNFVTGDQTRAEGSKSIETFGAAPLTAAPPFLPVAGADIIGASVAEDMIERVALGNIAAGPADDHGQFAFVVHLCARQVRREADGIAGILQGGNRLEDQDREIRDPGRGFSRVILMKVVRQRTGKRVGTAQAAFNTRPLLMHLVQALIFWWVLPTMACTT